MTTLMHTKLPTTFPDSIATLSRIARDIEHAMDGDVIMFITYGGLYIAPSRNYMLKPDEARAKAEADLARIVRFVKAYGPLAKIKVGDGMRLRLTLTDAEVDIDASATCERVETGTKIVTKKRPACPECKAPLETLDGGDQACSERGADHFYRPALTEVEEDVEETVYETRCAESVLR